MTTFRLERAGDVDLVFDGELLAEQSSELTARTINTISTTTGRRLRGKRWTEIRLYRTDSGKYVSEIVGESTVEGDKTRITVHVCATPTELRESLRVQRKHGPPSLTDMALDALDEAATKDPTIAEANTERI